MLPPFNAHGDLPAGVYQASLAETVARFGTGSDRRKHLGHRLERVYQIAASSAHLARFVVFGSFVTNKHEPGDVDVFLIMDDDFDVRLIKGETRLLFSHGTAQSHFGCSVFWIRRLAALGGEQQAIQEWQIKRDGTERGIVEIAE